MTGCSPTAAPQGGWSSLEQLGQPQEVLTLPRLSTALGRCSGRSRCEGDNGLALETQPSKTLRALGVLSPAKQSLSHDMMAARREQGAKESCSG